MPHPNIMVSYSDITVPQFSLNGLNVACVLDRYEKILTFPEFSSNYNHVSTTGGSYICFQHRINNSSPLMTQIMIGSVWRAQLSLLVIQLICNNIWQITWRPTWIDTKYQFIIIMYIHTLYWNCNPHYFDTSHMFLSACVPKLQYILYFYMWSLYYVMIGK